MTASKLYRVESFVQGLAIKAPCRAHTTAPITLNGLQTINTHVGQAGDRILVKDQLDPIENGIYTMEVSDWKRDGDFDGNRDVVGGTLVPVWDHTAGEMVQYEVVGEPTVRNPDIDSITFAVFNLGGVDPGENLELTAGGCLIVWTPDDLDNVTICMNDTEQAYPFLEFTATAACEIYRFDEGIWTIGTGLYIGGAGTKRLAFYGYGDAVRSSISEAGGVVTITSVGGDPALEIVGGGSLLVNAGGQLQLENSLGTENIFLYHDDIRAYLDVTGGSEGNLYLRVDNGSGTLVRRVTAQAGATGGVIITAGAGDNAVGRFNVQVSTDITSLEVKDTGDTYRQVGMAVLPRVNTTGATTLASTIWHRKLVATAAATATIESSSLADAPDDAVFWAIANGGALTLAEGAGITIRKFLGGGAATTGNAVIADGGWATVVKHSSTEVWVQGLDVT